MQAENKLIETLPVVVLKNTVVFPAMLTPLFAGTPTSVAAVEAALATEEKALVLVAQRDAAVEAPGPNDLFNVGTRGVIKKASRSEEGLQVLVQGGERVVLVKVDETGPYRKARVQARPSPDDQGAEQEALYRAILERAAHIVELVRPEVPFNVAELAAQAQDPRRVVYVLASMLSLGVQKEQALLEAPYLGGDPAAALRLHGA